MKILVVIITVLCLGIVFAVSTHVFTPIPEGSVCTPDGQTVDTEALKIHHLFWGIAIFAPFITLLVSACVILSCKEETRGEKIGSYLFFASILVLVIVSALCGN